MSCDNTQSDLTEKIIMSRMFFMVTYNGQGFVQVWNRCWSSPKPLLNKVIKVKANKQKLSDASPAGTNVELCKQPRFERPATLAQNFMLAVVLFVVV
jgi:hypothetical protein